MSHNWKTQPATRCCWICGAEQTRVGKSWTPRAHTCTNDGKGQPPRTQQAVLSALAEGSQSRKEIAEVCGKSVEAVASALTRLRQAGKVRRKDKGWKWELIEESSE